MDPTSKMISDQKIRWDTSRQSSNNPDKTSANKGIKRRFDEVPNNDGNIPTTLNKIRKKTRWDTPQQSVVVRNQQASQDRFTRGEKALISQLYSGKSCSNCDMRLDPTETTKYSKHLDWHFQQNRRARMQKDRQWYGMTLDWVEGDDGDKDEDRSLNYFEQSAFEQQRCPPPTSTPSCPAGSNQKDKYCCMCHGEFEEFFDDETEEWHFKNTIRVNGVTYHPLCYEDLKVDEKNE